MKKNGSALKSVTFGNAIFVALEIIELSTDAS